MAFIGMAIYIAVQPNDFDATETLTIKAPKAVIYGIVSDSTQTDWSSFWKETEHLLQSSQTPQDSIYQLFTSDDIKKSELKWIFVSQADGSTTVTRLLNAQKLSFMTKAKMVLFSDRQKAVIKQFKSELEDLNKMVLESMAVYSINIDGVTDYGGGFYMYNTISSTKSNIMASRNKQQDELIGYMNTNHIIASGMPFTMYVSTDLDNDGVIMSNCIPVSERVIVAQDSNVLCGFMNRTLALKVTLQGDYSNLEEAWDIAKKYIADNELEPSKMSPFEVYRNDSSQLPNPADWITEIYIPILGNLNNP